MSTYNTTIYREQGGDTLVIASGGKLDVQSGGELEVSSGATFDIDAAMDIDNTVTVGESDTGYDVKLWGATASNYWLWDESADGVRLSGTNATWHLGAFASTAAGSGFDMANSTAAFRVYVDDGDAELDAGDRRAGLFRYLLTKEQTKALTATAVRGQVKIAGDVDFDGDYLTGVGGYLELAGTNDLDADVQAFRGRVELSDDVTVAANKVLSAYLAELNVASGKSITATGVTGAIHVLAINDGIWDNLIAFDAADGDYSCGVKAVTKTPTGNTSHSIKVDIGGTSGYIPVYDDEAFNADDG